MLILIQRLNVSLLIQPHKKETSEHLNFPNSFHLYGQYVFHFFKMLTLQLVDIFH